ncbi:MULTISPECIES: hypothetical protein [Bacillaceae]|uniref:hypothetical protein n=1 Tax=Bacillaceae TaxID=186817 RepID=UPI0005A70C38|nr:hypothetical protein [Bacillus rubiinfantis]
MTEKYLVAQLDEREKTITKLKASLNDLSVDELVKRSIDEMQGTIPTLVCSYCDEKTVVTRKKPKQYTEMINGKEQIIEIVNYPLNVCKSCNAEYDDMDVSIYLKELVRFEILKSLRTGQPLPKDLDFEGLLKM